RYPSLMARILIACWGSHGDVDPSIGLGLGLRARGHAVTIATMPYFGPIVTAEGLDFHPIPPDISPTDTAIVSRLMSRWRGAEYIVKDLVAPQVAAMHAALLPRMHDTDLFISHPLAFAVPILAQRYGIPWASTVLSPISLFSATDLPIFPPAPWVRHVERLGTWPGRFLARSARMSSKQWTRPVAALRRREGLPPAPSPLFEGQHSPHLVLALFSKVLGVPQPDWPANIMVTGQMFHDAAHGTALSPEIERFLDAGPAPILFTLGSSAVLTPGRFWEESLAAVRALGQRAICLVGPENPGMLRASYPPEVLVVERAPHSLLMPRCAVVVQQCGVGTLMQALRAGVPTLAVPFANDQPDNAYRAAKLGVARIVAAPRYRRRRVAVELDRLLTDPAYRAASARVAAEVRAERGVAGACDAIERTFAEALGLRG
ncbi:MAG: glycosyltransferase, partial [Gemmatimonadota bacterium]